MEPSIFLRMNEDEASIRPSDAAGGLADLVTATAFGTGSSTMPALVNGVMGGARAFDGAGSGLVARDQVSGSTLYTRDVSIQAILTWDDTLADIADPGTIIARGLGTSAAEYLAWGLEVRLVNAANRIGELRWLWHDAAGVLRTQVGGHFQAPDGFVMVTATRRWVSSTEVVLRYFLGDELLAEVPSVDGSIGGGTTAATSVGMRYTGAAFGRWYGGKIDELRVLGRELAPEEVAATWRRITVDQPNGYRLLRELHDPGFPISDDPGSRVQRETRMWGHALGYAASQAENVRANLLPDRAYGPVLERWEQITRQPSRPGDSLEQRRARVLARAAQDEGSSPPGVRAVLRELAATSEDNLQILAFSNTITDDFATVDPLRWELTPSAQWTSLAGTLRVQAAAGTYEYPARTHYTALTSIPSTPQGHGAVTNDGRELHAIVKISVTALPANAHAGLMITNRAAIGSATFFGVRNLAGSYQLVAEEFRDNVSQGIVVLAALGGAPAAMWLHLRTHYDPASVTGLEQVICAWSTTSATAGYTEAAPFDHTPGSQWVGMFLRTVGAIAGAADVRFDDMLIRAPYGDRPFHAYIYRDPTLPGRLDRIGANAVIRELAQAHIQATVTSSLTFVAGDPLSIVGETPV